MAKYIIGICICLLVAAAASYGYWYGRAIIPQSVNTSDILNVSGNRIVLWKGNRAQRTITQDSADYKTIEPAMRTMLENTTDQVQSLVTTGMVKTIRSDGAVEITYQPPHLMKVLNQSVEVSSILIPLAGKFAKSTDSTTIVCSSPDISKILVDFQSADALKADLQQLK